MMKNTILLICAMALPLPASLAEEKQPLRQAQSRPNILFILADDQSPFDLKMYDPSSPLDTTIVM